MSQVMVERVVGMLVTDERVRRRFTTDPQSTIEELVEKGLDLNECERWALSRLDPRDLERFADSMDSRLQKTELGSERT